MWYALNHKHVLNHIPSCNMITHKRSTSRANCSALALPQNGGFLKQGKSRGDEPIKFQICQIGPIESQDHV